MKPKFVRVAMFGIALTSMALSGCDRNRSDDRAEPEPVATETPDVVATQSIFAPEAGIEPTPELLEPLQTSVRFAEKSAELSEAAQEQLESVLESPQNKAGGRIMLGGHSDAGGNDAANLRASKARAEAVRDWLVEKGVDETRISIAVFGEQNPIKPNALPDGSPNEEGRAANRRVEIEIGGDEEPEQDAQAEPDSEAPE